MTFAAALGNYIAARTEYERLAALEDAAFVRWFTRANDGGPKTNGAAASRAANRANEASAEMASAEIALYAAADREGYSPNLDACYGAVGRYAAVRMFDKAYGSDLNLVRDLITGKHVAQFGPGLANQGAAEREAARRNGEEI